MLRCGVDDTRDDYGLLLLLLHDGGGRDILLIRRHAALSQRLQVRADPGAFRQSTVAVDRPLNILHLQRTHVYQLKHG